MRFARPGRLPIGLAAAFPATLYLPAEVGRRLFGLLPTDLERFMERPLMHIGQLPLTPWFLVKALIYLLVLGLIASGARRFLQKRILPRTSMEPGHQYALARWTQYVVFAVGLIIGLQSSGLNLNSLLVVGGALGVGIGFGLQNIVNNFVSGLILLIEQPVRVGDIVDVGATQGEVLRIGGRSTWLRTGANARIIVPNSDLVSNRVTNWTAGGSRVLVNAKIGVSYGSDPDQVRSILLDVARRSPAALAAPAPGVTFDGFGSSALEFELWIWFPGTVMQAGGYRSELNFALFRALKENGIEIPFPQHDVHLRSADGPIPAPNVT
ncbi:MAG TPA: mechanosensitive ion channel domain-containing protein [Candidatus Acidoferrales bacterium]|nr:mechanosensitive ion channel domain-containing protein [Candidatus Acidoferrales bacterium]